MSEELRPVDFRDLAAPLSMRVRIGETESTLELAVESVDPLPPHRLRAEPFSLILAGPASPALPQATYAVSHPTLGVIRLFLVPVSRDTAATRYEVTFN